MVGWCLSRRVMLRGGLVASAAWRGAGAHADEPVDPDRLELPQRGDRLVDAGSGASTAPLTPDDLGLQDPFLAWAFDPQRQVPRDGSRLNMVLLMRFDPATLGSADSRQAAGGVVAYSAVCTHQQCWVTDWLKSAQVLQCPCHQSQYDPRHGAKVVGGPAPRPLPALPLTLTDGVLSIAGPFNARVGGEQQQNT